MAKIKNAYKEIRESRERIVKAMQERGIKELAMYMSYGEWCKENDLDPEEVEEDDNERYLDYKDSEAPYVIFFDKWSTGIDYRVDKVVLKEGDGGPRLEFDCYANEYGSDTFGEDDVVFLTLYNVYEATETMLGIEAEPEKVVVLYEVDECDNTKSGIVAMTETGWEARKPEAIEEALRKHFDESYADADDDYFCYEDEIRQAVEALTTGYDTEFNGDSLFWDEVEMM